MRALIRAILVSSAAVWSQASDCSPSNANCAAPWSKAPQKPDAASECADAIGPARTGDLHTARRQALATYRRLGGSYDAGKVCGRVWQQTLDEMLVVDGFLDLVTREHQKHASTRFLEAPTECWDREEGKRTWMSCCPNALGDAGDPACFDGASWTYESCCTFANGSSSFLTIPALQEVAVHLRLPQGQLLRIEQDGFLRPFDLPTVFWPAGYLLSQWIGDASQCERWQGARVLELGAGVGAASVAAASCGADVVATDLEMRSLALTLGNAALNNVSVRARAFDWHSDADLAAIKALGPFDAIVGSSLKVEEWAGRFWEVMDVLSNPADDGETLIAMAHGVDALQPPGHFEVLNRISGDLFGMGREDRVAEAASSDFEMVLVMRA